MEGEVEVWGGGMERCRGVRAGEKEALWEVQGERRSVCWGIG